MNLYNFNFFDCFDSFSYQDIDLELGYKVSTIDVEKIENICNFLKLAELLNCC